MRNMKALQPKWKNRLPDARRAPRRPKAAPTTESPPQAAPGPARPAIEPEPTTGPTPVPFDLQATLEFYSKEPRVPHPTDLHVGKRLRAARRERGMSQETLAEKLDLTFQQVQKYEKAANRMSASKLYQACRVLQVPVSYFFADLEPPTIGPPVEARDVGADLVATPGGLALAEAYLAMGTATRQVCLDMAATLTKRLP